MKDETVVSIIAIAAGTTVTMTNLIINGDGVSVTALFALIGTLVGFAFGKGQTSQNKDS